MSLSLSIQSRHSLLEVSIANKGNESIKLWALTYLPGYHSIYFRISGSATNDLWIKRKQVRWTVNAPDYYIINPGESRKIDLDLNDGTWDLPALPPGKEMEISAVLEILEDDETLRSGVLTGRYESNKISFDPSTVIKQ